VAKELKDYGLIAKGIALVRFGSKVYSVEREGLYRFMTLPRGLRNLISLRNSQSPIPLLMALSALQVHGNRQDAEDHERLKNRLQVEPWVCLTCGNVASLVASIVEAEGYKARIVNTETSEEKNGYDDGHSMLEVYSPQLKKWILVDADMGILFKDDGIFLSAAELAGRVKKNKRPEFVVLAQKAAVLDPFFLGPDGYNYALEFRWRWRSPEGKWRWYRRVLQRMPTSI
jgi:hypothetical protein